jgi:hypothetical protein
LTRPNNAIRSRPSDDPRQYARAGRAPLSARDAHANRERYPQQCKSNCVSSATTNSGSLAIFDCSSLETVLPGFPHGPRHFFDGAVSVRWPEAVLVRTFRPRMVCTVCGIVGADTARRRPFRRGGQLVAREQLAANPNVASGRNSPARAYAVIPPATVPESSAMVPTTALPTPARTAARLSLATALLPPTAATAFFTERRSRDEQTRGDGRHKGDFA